MIQASPATLLSAAEAAQRLGVTPRRVYALIDAGMLQAERVGGRLLVDRDAVEARVGAEPRVGRPFSPRRAWALLLLAAGQEPSELDPATRSKLRRILRERDLWLMRNRFVRRAERRPVRAHSSDLGRIAAEPDVVRTGARHAADAGLDLVAPDAPLELYVDGRTADRLAGRYRLSPSRQPNLVLRVVPDAVRPWLRGAIAPWTAVALDLADDLDPRSRDVAREVLSRR